MQQLVDGIVNSIHSIIPEFIKQIPTMEIINMFRGSNSTKTLITNTSVTSLALFATVALVVFIVFGIFSVYVRLTFLNIHPLKMYMEMDLDKRKKANVYGMLKDNAQITYLFHKHDIVRFLFMTKIGKILETDFGKEYKENIDI